ncbi:hypothetical protein BDV33DRAFT_195358 [Aspergillus novoparasiticus]|uniref:Cyanovirin-N domain-containing protein n=1 Tax=Aspergillus novoparasiticus TaxID=986946 RepID=A0A5N6ECY4_9EURO|nr:hypothetical protein BDV33DRAFT_195358 [Aspergillus novoparasiticus]
MRFISVVILSFLSALAAAEPDVKMVDFTVNCKTWKIASHTLEATCPDWDGNYKDSSLDLNQCYTYNRDFQLEFKVDGAAFDTCISCELETDLKKPPLLTCDCMEGGDIRPVPGHTRSTNTTLGL